MILFTVEGYLHWYKNQKEQRHPDFTMGSRIEPNGFQLENWSEETIEILYQARLLEFLRKFNGHSGKVT